MADKFISANALIKDLLNKSFYPVFVRRAIEDAPAVDVVEVVRCKDCMWCREKNEKEKAYLIEEVDICTNCDATDDGWNPVFPEHFCSYGEKK